MSDLFEGSELNSKTTETYTAQDIEVLEGLEPVRKRPGMYIGGTDENALHHLIAEVFDNSMDEAVAGHASRIEVHLAEDSTLTISDNGRGIPVDPHPKYPDKSALEVILTTLHSGGKFSNKAYATSGGLHGVGISVVNALSDKVVIEVARNKQLHTQTYSKGLAQGPIELIGEVSNRRGTTISFHPDFEIFDEGAAFRAARVYGFIKSKAYLYKGVEIRWSCDESLVKTGDKTPVKDVIHFEEGLKSYMQDELHGAKLVVPEMFCGEAELAGDAGKIEWAVAWPNYGDGFIKTYCNTIGTPLGGTHENGYKLAITKGLKSYADMAGNKKAEKLTTDDILGGACVVVSLFYRDPQFQGQTKEKLVSSEVSKLVDSAVKDHFDHWLADHSDSAGALLEHFIARMDERLARRAKNTVNRKSPTQRLRLPGKLADCSASAKGGSELFIVEGDSAGGSAKQARNRENQAILPLRGKILNVASATMDKIAANQELKDLETALGCGTGSKYVDDDLRYDKVIIMTDADVDGAHIAALLMTYFFQQMPKLLSRGHLYLAQPPLFRITIGKETFYAQDEAERDALVAAAPGNKRLEVGRFKGLGEMTAPQLKETTMHPAKRNLLKVTIEDAEKSADLVERLMGKKPEHRLAFIQANSKDAEDLVDV